MSFSTDRIEKILLAGQWESDAPEPWASLPIAKLAKDVVQGAFRDVLTSSYARELFRSTSQTNVELKPYKELFDFTLPSVSDEAEEELVRLILAVACLHAFVQVNWTGPDLDVQPSEVIIFPNGSSLLNEASLNAKAVAELAYGGEPAYHLVQHATLLRLTQLLLDLPYRHCTSTPWWKLRTSLIHEQLLDEPVPHPPGFLPSVEPLYGGIASDPDLAGRLLLEEGLLEHMFSHDKSAAEYFVRAAHATGLQYELTGAMGKRTKFQQTELSQLILLAESRERGLSTTSDHSDVEQRSAVEQSDPRARGPSLPETLLLNDDTLLEQTEFTSSAPSSTTSLLGHLNPSSQPPLHPLDQCILLSLCLNIRNTSPSHGLTSEQMSPYVTRVITHPKNWSVHTMALLLRSRLESSRTRTVERSTLQLQALIDQMPTADSSLSERMLYFHSISLPSKWEMERELALRFLSLGVVKSALEIFERLEMWEEVAKCWQSMERRDKAIAIVRDLLEGRREEADSVILRAKATSTSRLSVLDTARQAKLWCLLGDLEPDNAIEHYERAWTISSETSGRAMRSLGGYYFTQGDFKKAIQCLQRAVKINPLLSRSWFILGCAFIREECWEGARDAFSRCVSIDDEDGESWNNLASMYLRLDGAAEKQQNGEPHTDGDEIPEGTSFSNKTLAFRALKQGLKYSYENWRMWSNYMIVAMDVGELSEACRAQARIIEERAAKIGAESVDEEVIERLVDAVTRAPADPDDAVEGSGAARDAIKNPNEGHGLFPRVQDLFDRSILPRVSSPRIFRAYARLLTWQSRWEDALRAYLDAYRGGAAGTYEKGETDVGKWREAVSEVEEIVAILGNFGPRVEGYNWKLQGRSIVRTFMGRSKDFEDEAEWTRLSDLQAELRSEE
ncbi:TPR-like protein [Leucogyrophana mollusca]|uniref:TPR-like protein n=1 Tax=Leucogyrophana mollusca TaxID=85980 RepID=A0ACB8BMS4_9AGAM|nr:TPR-like protein [Leucogyrophana mollusca]